MCVWKQRNVWSRKSVVVWCWHGGSAPTWNQYIRNQRNESICTQYTTTMDSWQRKVTWRAIQVRRQAKVREHVLYLQTSWRYYCMVTIRRSTHHSKLHTYKCAVSKGISWSFTAWRLTVTTRARHQLTPTRTISINGGCASLYIYRLNVTSRNYNIYIYKYIIFKGFSWSFTVWRLTVTTRTRHQLTPKHMISINGGLASLSFTIYRKNVASINYNIHIYKCTISNDAQLVIHCTKTDCYH